MNKTTMREAFERVEVKPGVDVPLVKRVMRVLHRNAGIQPPRRRTPSQPKQPA